MNDPVHVLSDIDARAVAERLDDTATDATGHGSLGDAAWRSLRDPDARAATFALGVGADARALAHVAPSDTFRAQHWVLSLATDHVAGADAGVDALIGHAITHIARHGGGETVIWRFDPSPDDDVVMARNGFAHDRDLLQMRVPLPTDQTAPLPDRYSVRTFEVGRDEVAWLEVNNRAFENHAEQGAWIRSTLERRLGEPWFDPELFLLASDEIGLAGFNWLKIHEAHAGEPALGEIFVIGVDPRAQGTGLGRALTLLGLDRLADRGITTGMLYVAGENEGARALYESVGFDTHRRDRAYVREVAAR